MAARVEFHGSQHPASRKSAKKVPVHQRERGMNGAEKSAIHAKKSKRITLDTIQKMKKKGKAC